MRAGDAGVMPRNTGSALAGVGWFLSIGLCIFTVENLWIDPWLRAVALPSLVPQALGGKWMLTATAIAVGVVLLILCQILMWKSGDASGWKKLLRALAAACALMLCGAWFASTSGMEAGKHENLSPKAHSVTLHWERSTTLGVRYNVYRTTTRGKNYVKLNDKPLDEPTYKDEKVKSGVTYYYVTRSVDAAGKESVDSNEALATVP